MNAVIPCPPATARTGWTVYARGTREVLGWVRRAESCDPCYERPAGTFWAIPRHGVSTSDQRNYATVADAAASITREATE